MKGFNNDDPIISTKNVNIKTLKPNLHKYIDFDIESVPICIKRPQLSETYLCTPDTPVLDVEDEKVCYLH